MNQLLKGGLLEPEPKRQNPRGRWKDGEEFVAVVSHVDVLGEMFVSSVFLLKAVPFIHGNHQKTREQKDAGSCSVCNGTVSNENPCSRNGKRPRSHVKSTYELSKPTLLSFGQSIQTLQNFAWFYLR